MLALAAVFTLTFPSSSLAGPVTGLPKLIVGGDHDNPPYEFVVNGQATGFNIELLRAVARIEGLTMEFRLGPWGTVRKALEKGEIDALAGMYYSAERSRVADFSVPHTLATPAIFVRKGSPVRSLESMRGREIIVQNGDVAHDFLREKGLASRIITVTDPGEVLRLLASGKHDCALMPSLLQGEYLVRKYGLGNLTAITTGLPQFNYCFAVRKGDRELLSRLDEGLNILRVTGEYREIYDKWFGVYEQKALWDTLKYYILALALALMLFLGFLIWSATLKRQVDLRTAELRRREEDLRFTQYAIDSTVSQAFWMTDDGRLFYVNDAACRALGFTRDELLGMTIRDIDPTYPLERFAEQWRDLREHGALTFETRHQAKDGRIYPVEIRANYVVFDGKEYYCAFATDISERKRAEEELRQAHDELEKRVEARTMDLLNTNRLLQHEITVRKKAEEALRESESAVRLKLESILDPQGDIGELDLADIIDAAEIQVLMDDLYRLAGIKMSIIDLKGRVLVNVGWQDICLKFHRAHPESLKKCLESDTELAVGVPAGEFRSYKCKNNMWHLVTPIIVGGKHLGNLFMGQFFFENEQLDYDLFRSQSSQYGFPEEAYIAALEAVPRHSEERVNKAKAVFLRLTDMFSKLSYSNIKLARSLTERERLTETLQEANLVVENSPVVLFRWGADDTWPVELVSGNVLRFGYTPDEFLSGAITYSVIIHPDDLHRVVREVRDYCAEGADQFRLEYRIMTKGGEVRWVNEHTKVDRNAEGCLTHFQGIVIDVTDRKRMEEAIHESRAKYQAIVDNIDGIIYICSQDYRIEFMNRKLIDRTGYDGAGEFCYRVLHDRDSICPWCVNERVFAGETLHWEMFSPKDQRWFHVVNVPIRRADGSMSKQSMMLDITDRKMFEEQLQRQKQQLAELNSTLENRVREEVAKNRAKDILLLQQNRQAALGEMLDHITHQWKQPLNGIYILMQYLEIICSSGELSEEQVSETVKSSLSLLEHMSQTIDVFRDFYRPEKEKSVFRIKDSLESALMFFEPALKFHAIRIDQDVDPALSAIGYPKEYTQVLLNILANARDAFKERGVEHKHLKIRAFADGSRAVVTIGDNAGGIPETIIGRVFDLYFSTRGSSGGSGVGLYMSKNIIEKNMGGTLSAENIEGGALFRIELNMPL
jgi:PAS domain S-box-containing protein